MHPDIAGWSGPGLSPGGHRTLPPKPALARLAAALAALIIGTPLPNAEGVARLEKPVVDAASVNLKWNTGGILEIAPTPTGPWVRMDSGVETTSHAQLGLELQGHRFFRVVDNGIPGTPQPLVEGDPHRTYPIRAAFVRKAPPTDGGNAALEVQFEAPAGVPSQLPLLVNGRVIVLNNLGQGADTKPGDSLHSAFITLGLDEINAANKFWASLPEEARTRPIFRGRELIGTEPIKVYDTAGFEKGEPIQVYPAPSGGGGIQIQQLARKARLAARTDLDPIPGLPVPVDPVDGQTVPPAAPEPVELLKIPSLLFTNRLGTNIVIIDLPAGQPILIGGIPIQPLPPEPPPIKPGDGTVLIPPGGGIAIPPAGGLPGGIIILPGGGLIPPIPGGLPGLPGPIVGGIPLPNPTPGGGTILITNVPPFPPGNGGVGGDPGGGGGGGGAGGGGGGGAGGAVPPVPPPPIAGGALLAKSLMITDLSVVEDPTRTWDPCTPNRGTRMGAWTFGRLMTDMANEPRSGIPAPEFVRRWLRTWQTQQVINFDTVTNRNVEILTEVIKDWEVASGGPDKPLDLSIAPFRLLAIVNRVDLRGNAGYGSGNNEDPCNPPCIGGEARFVFGVVPGLKAPLPAREGAGARLAGYPGSQPSPTNDVGGVCGELPFTVILEYCVPKNTCDEIRAWGLQWFNLSLMPFGPAFNDALQRITDQFALAGADPRHRPNESAISQVRSNELLRDPWELREWRIFGNDSDIGHLREVTVKQTPDFDLNFTRRIVDFCNAFAGDIAAGKHIVPLQFGTPLEPFLGGSAPMPKALFWDGPPPHGTTIPTAIRHPFSLATCNGCHAGETATPFTHVFTRLTGQEAKLSDFLTGANMPKVDPADNLTPHVFADLKRRELDLLDLIATPCFFQIFHDPVPMKH